MVILHANSQRGFEYQEKVLREILAETQGEHLQLFEDDKIRRMVAWHVTRVSTGSRQTFRASGGSLGMTAISNWAILPGMRGDISKTATLKYIEKGMIVDDGGDGGYNTLIEYGHMGQNALGAKYDPTDPESRKAVREIGLEFSRLGLAKYNYVVPVQTDAAVHEALGQLQSNYHLWQRKIKKVLDPNVVADPTNYIDVKPPSTLPTISK
jgi:hypothetical protein